MGNDIYEILKKYWAYEEFREPQKEIIQSVLKGFDTMSILATGSGKSLCYQIPALSLNTCCLVISPLIALMKDQMDGLKKRNIKAIAVHSGLSKREQDIQLDNVAYGEVNFLFVSPERLRTDMFLQRLEKMNIGLIAVDEAHCISEWGHDFRPSYRDIAQLRERLPGVPLIALTATANRKVQKDIIENLKLRDPKVFIQSPVRSNLEYKTHYTENRRNSILNLIHETEGSVIVYVNKRLHTRELESFLKHRNIDVRAYHAGLEQKEKEEILDAWNKDSLKTIIATNAFGMGMDKAGVRTVIHYSIPRNLESYVQEAGRAGRDGKPAKGVILWNAEEERQYKESPSKYYPPLNEIASLYQNLAIHFGIASGKQIEEWYDLDLNGFCQKHAYSKFYCINILSILRNSKLISLSESFDHPSRIKLNTEFALRYLRSDKASEKMKRILDFVLRTYEGIRWTYKSIDEKLIAKKTGMDAELCVKAFESMEKMQLLEYSKGFIGHKVSFNEFRYDKAELRLSAEVFHKRKKRMEENVLAMLSYLKTRDCRQQFISRYFDIELEDECKICDNCEENLTNQEIERIIQAMIKDNLKLSSKLMQFNSDNRERIIKALKVMKDELLIKIENDLVSEYE